MNTDYQLSDTLIETFESQCAQAVRHAEVNEENTGAILSEWSFNGNDCLITRYLNNTTHEVKETLLYISFVNNNLIEGEFWFDPEAQLPTDNI